MKRVMVLAISVAAVCGVAMAQPPAAGPAGRERPAVFAALTFDEALKANSTDGKLLFVKGTADWCQPCKVMDATTFRDVKVVEWFRDRGSIIDVDTDEHRDVGQRLRVKSLPTIVVFRNGVEIDRAMGLLNPSMFAAWQDRLGKGQTNMSIIAERIAASQAAPTDRLVYADHLMSAGKLDDATREVAWLWENLAQAGPQAAGMRAAMVGPSVEELISTHAAARERFVAVRDMTESRVMTDPGAATELDDWLMLNGALGDDARTLAWFDKAKADEPGRNRVRMVWYRLDPVLTRAGRWADLPTIHADPVARVQQNFTVVQRARQMGGPSDVDAAFTLVRAEAAKLYAGLLAAGRDEDAAKLASVALSLDDTPAARVAMVTKAVEIGQPRESQRAILAAASDKGADVKELAAALEAALLKK